MNAPLAGVRIVAKAAQTFELRHRNMRRLCAALAAGIGFSNGGAKGGWISSIYRCIPRGLGAAGARDDSKMPGASDGDARQWRTDTNVVPGECHTNCSGSGVTSLIPKAGSSSFSQPRSLQHLPSLPCLAAPLISR